jgi:hypothetical protein
MFNKKWESERFGKDICRNIRGRYPICAEGASGNVITNEMMLDINML